MTRTRKLASSATSTAPLGSTATPSGEEKAAAVPMASANAAAPLPASVVTTPPGVTARTRWLAASATTALPLASTATPAGLLNCALVPAPLAKAPQAKPLQPAEPASEVTTPEGLTLRRRWLKESATSTAPLGSTATPRGELKEAAAPAPSAKAPSPLPASVLTKPPGVTRRSLWLS
jgi:hypothetical protein